MIDINQTITMFPSYEIEIILYTTADLEGNTICARADGSVTVINESELEELLTAQQK